MFAMHIVSSMLPGNGCAKAGIKMPGAHRVRAKCLSIFTTPPFPFLFGKLGIKTDFHGDAIAYLSVHLYNSHSE
jgi:hypothetical protein